MKAADFETFFVISVLQRWTLTSISRSSVHLKGTGALFIPEISLNPHLAK